jgi:hypothetical protein
VFVEMTQMIHFYMYFDSCNPYSLAHASLVPRVAGVAKQKERLIDENNFMRA